MVFPVKMKKNFTECFFSEHELLQTYLCLNILILLLMMNSMYIKILNTKF